ncbi:MAG: NAD-dependent DNA ligase LigA, partial [Lachnospiraceae bacterium]|nr:NAD-dependent DNA ligase LigA [Lachnospiraceae bacterium]
NGETQLRTVKEAVSLYCTNPSCPAKQIKKFAHFVSRDALNVEGLSEATLEKFVDCGFIKEYADIFKLDRFKDDIVSLEGFGERSYQNLQDSIEKSKDTTLAKFVYSLGVPGVGLANAKLITKALKFDPEAVFTASSETLSSIPGIGDVIGEAFAAFFKDPDNRHTVDTLMEFLRMRKEDATEVDSELNGKTIVITGSLNLFENRNELKDAIEKKGGKVSGSVSGNTFLLINNDITSASSKNKTAKELNVPIITEEEFVTKYLK